MSLRKLKLAGLVAAALLALSPGMASAAGTAAGTVITNLADLTFAVGGVTQPVVQSNGGVSTDFTVDRKVNINIVASDAAPGVAITPGAAAGAAVLTYKVTNTGNDVEDFALTATALAGGASAFGGTDTIDAGTVSVFVETNGTPGYQAGADTATFIDELPADGYTSVYIVSGAIPATAVNGDIASYHLTATAHQGGAVGTQGAVETATAGAGTLNAVDVVFADGAGSNDAANDGAFSVQDDFIVQSAVISVAKTAVVKSDPVNGTTNPQAIPGAVITYTITISNAATATASANLTTISDVLNAALQINATGASWTVTGSTRAVATGALLADTADANADGLGITDAALPGGTLTAAYNTILAADAVNGYAAGELKPGESVDLVFDVTLQ